MSQTPPDPTSLKFALDQFGADAQLWQAGADALATASTAARGVAIDPFAFGPAAWFDLAHSYALVQQMISDRLAEGATQLAAVATNLIEARDTYRREEDANVHLIKGIW